LGYLRCDAEQSSTKADNVLKPKTVIAGKRLLGDLIVCEYMIRAFPLGVDVRGWVRSTIWTSVVVNSQGGWNVGSAVRVIL
jgi:hypothetical protein